MIGCGCAKNGSALLTTELEMFQLIGRGLTLNGSYVVEASCLRCRGVRMCLLSFNATAPAAGGGWMRGGAAGVRVFFLSFFGVYDIHSVQIRQL